MSLAIRGGRPVTTETWPRWPMPAPRALQSLAAVLESGRWSLSGPYQGATSAERRFAAAFAAFCATPYCVPTCSGTASLSTAFEALGLRPGDEVVVPGLTWVACATAVANLGGVPVLTDVSPGTYCLSPAAVEAAITPATVAVLAVHLYSAVADLEALQAVASRHGLALIEDCAQSHGARWRDRPVGSWGLAGTFSMQHSKVLTAGEGGAVVTHCADLFRKMEQLRADGRRYADGDVDPGRMELVEVGELTGSNRCLSELHAALLLAQMETLEEQNRLRSANAGRLDALLREDGWSPQATSTGTTARTYYRYAVAFDREAFAGCSAARIARALSAELGFEVAPCYPPLNASRLYRPESRSRYHWSAKYLERIAPASFDLPECHRAHGCLLTLPHAVLLSEPERMEAIADAFRKVRRHRDELRGEEGTP